MRKELYFCSVVAGLLLTTAGSAGAAIVYWTDWTSKTSQTVTGTITLADLSTVDVTYTGDIAFAQTSGGTFYWTNPATYQSSVVDNAPATSDIIALDGGGTALNTVTFSRPVTNPIMAIVSLGAGGTPVYYDFDAPFDILSSGSGYWGGGKLQEAAGDILLGYEGHGTIQFLGTYSSISWTSTNEYWHGFTVGTTVPEPATCMLISMGLALTRLIRKR